jgi:hypothetical protein
MFSPIIISVFVAMTKRVKEITYATLFLLAEWIDGGTFMYHVEVTECKSGRWDRMVTCFLERLVDKIDWFPPPEI